MTGLSPHLLSPVVPGETPVLLKGIAMEMIPKLPDDGAKTVQDDPATGTGQVTAQWPPQTTDVCPHCGYCPHCGRSRYPGYYWPRYPYGGYITSLNVVN